MTKTLIAHPEGFGETWTVGGITHGAPSVANYANVKEVLSTT